SKSMVNLACYYKNDVKNFEIMKTYLLMAINLGDYFAMYIYGKYLYCHENERFLGLKYLSKASEINPKSPVTPDKKNLDLQPQLKINEIYPESLYPLSRYRQIPSWTRAFNKMLLPKNN